MVANASLISQIPMPTTVQSKVAEAPLASVKVGEIASDNDKMPEYNQTNTFLGKLKNKLIEYRIKQLEAKSPEKRTPMEQAEYEANQQSLNYVV